MWRVPCPGMEFTVQQLSDLLGGRLAGDGTGVLRAVGRIEDAGPGALAFLSNPVKYGAYAYETAATALLVPEGWAPERAVSAALIYVPNVQQATAQLFAMYAAQRPRPRVGTHATAVVEAGAEVSPEAHVGAFVYVGAGAVVGPGTVLEPHSFVGRRARTGRDCLLQTGARLLEECVLGDRVRLLANSVVGADGFGHEEDPETGAWTRIPHIGNVVVGDDCEIGACATVDRAVVGSTVLAEGVKLDNLVMVAHNVSIGAHTAAAAQVGIAGSAHIGARVRMGGQVGTAGHIRIADGVEVAAQSGIKDAVGTPGQKLFGSPAKPFRDWARDQARLRSVDRLAARVKALEQALAQLRHDGAA